MVVVIVLQTILMASDLYMPPHGSPNTLLLAGTVQFVCPTQALVTTLAVVAALHVGSTWNPPAHVPVGVPYDANISDDMTEPAGQISTASLFSVTSAHV